MTLVWVTDDGKEFQPSDEQKRVLEIARKYMIKVEFVPGGWIFHKNDKEDSGQFDLPDWIIDTCAAKVAGMERK